MPKDDWAKYARRDRGRKALANGNYFKVGDDEAIARVLKKEKKADRRAWFACGMRRRKNGMYRVRQAGFMTVDYPDWPPERCIVRYVVSQDYSLPIPPWPGFG